MHYFIISENNIKKITKSLSFLLLSLLFVSCNIPPKDYLRHAYASNQMRTESRDLDLIDGKFYKNGELFSGLYWNEGYFISAEIENGLLHGEVVTFGNTEEVSVYHYKNGNVTGKCFGYNSENFEQILWDIKFKDGNGVLKEYYKDGSIKSEVEYINYKMEGERFIYYTDGTIKEKMYYKNGKLHGEHITYYDKDRTKYVGKYSDGVLTEATGWHDNGKIALEKKDGVVKFYDYSGFMKRKNDLKEMKQYYYYDTGELEKQEYYLKAELHPEFPAASEIYYYNQLGLLTWKREIFNYKLDDKKKLITDVELKSDVEFVIGRYLFNELGQLITSGWGMGNYYVYGNQSRILFEVFQSGLFADENRALDEKDDFFSNQYRPLEYDERGRVIEKKIIYDDGMTGKESMTYNERGQLTRKSTNIIGDEGYIYKYDEKGNMLEAHNYGVNRSFWKKTYKYDEEGREIEEYRQFYKKDIRKGDFPEPGLLIKKGSVIKIDNKTNKEVYLEKIDELDSRDERYDTFTYVKKYESNKLIYRSRELMSKDGERHKPYIRNYLYYKNADEISNSWSDIEEIGKLLIKKDIRRNDVLLYN